MYFHLEVIELKQINYTKKNKKKKKIINCSLSHEDFPNRFERHDENVNFIWLDVIMQKNIFTNETNNSKISS